MNECMVALGTRRRDRNLSRDPHVIAVRMLRDAAQRPLPVEAADTARDWNRLQNGEGRRAEVVREPRYPLRVVMGDQRGPPAVVIHLGDTPKPARVALLALGLLAHHVCLQRSELGGDGVDVRLQQLRNRYPCSLDEWRGAVQRRHECMYISARPARIVRDLRGQDGLFGIVVFDVVEQEVVAQEATQPLELCVRVAARL
mmetsp:Transcript_82207/g.232754  ORF Transcript_82207/g.232754 Transcript_82207/m.232754 type:complete len:200 (+) Transcript_82207:85-684(+)